ncbi:MAG TPA: condensation domain-containing protein, partial [Micromonospora sp.]
MSKSGSKSGFVDVWPLSPLQQGLLFHALYEETGTGVYVIQMTLDLRREVDVETLREAVRIVLRRHDNLRASFRNRKTGEPVQVILREVEPEWAEFDLSGLPEADRQAELDRLLADDRARTFDLAQPPLRFALIRLAEQRYQFLFTAHHILLDGWSMPLVLGELFALYNSGGDDSVLPPVMPYKEYLVWLARQDRGEAERAWRRALDGLTEPTLVAPVDPSRVPVLPTMLLEDVPAELTAKVVAQARTLGLTMNSVVQTVWAAVLGQLTGRDDVVFGGTVSGRPPELPGSESMIGLFINTQPVRARLDPTAGLGEVARDLQDRQSDLQPYQYLGLAEIQRLTGLGELFDAMAVFENYPVDADNLERSAEGIGAVSAGSVDATHYPLSLASVLRGDELTIRLDYQPDLFDEATARALVARMVRLLEVFATDPHRPTARIDLLTADERDRVLTGFNHTGGPRPTGTVVSLFEEHAEREPDAPVLVDAAGGTVSYAELNLRANRLAHELIARGAGPERLVGIALPRSADLLVAMLAVVKAGAAYLPIDPDYPAERIGWMLTDASPAALLTTSVVAEALPGTDVPLLALDAPAT